MHRAMRRRLLTGAAAALAPAAFLAGCGFELRRAPQLRFRTIRLSGFAQRSPLAAELRRQIDASATTRVVEAAKDAEVTLRVDEDAREKSVVATTAAGQVREFELRARFRFAVVGASGRELLAPSEILQKRNLTFTETAALAKEEEEAFLFRAMQTDIVAQVLRRLAAIVPA
jgi:LPS-assembly lipoprotein